MLNPKDFGDPHPSDIGDVAPANPTDNFSEVDYSIQSVNKPVPKAKPSQQFSKPGTENKPELHRDTFTGIVTLLGDKNKSPRQFTVLTQTLRRIQAVAAGMENVYSDLRIGDSVTVTRGELPDTWVLAGAPRADELPTIVLGTNGVQGNNVLAVPFNQLKSQTGDDTILVQNGNGVKIGGSVNQEFQVQISLDITIETVGSHSPLTAGPPTVTAQAACLDGGGGEFLSLKYPFKSIRFDRGVGFKVFQPSPNLAEVTISGESTYNMLYQPGGGGSAVWTNWPIIAGALTIGQMAPQAWLILENSAGTHVWLGTGDKNLKYVFPSNDAQQGSHLMVQAVSGEGIKLKHSKAGGSGEVSFLNCSYECKTLKFEDGLVVSGPGISGPSEGGGGSVDIQPPVRTDANPCV